MKKFLFLSGFIVCFLVLNACSMMTKDNRPKPAELVAFKPSVAIKQLWVTRVGEGAKKYYLRMMPAVLGNRIFTVDYNGNVTAVNRQSGKIVWKVNIDTKATSGVCVDSSQLFIGTGNGNIVSLSQIDGHQIWKTPVSSEILATPVAIHNRIFVKSIDGSVTALSQRDGRQLWHYNETVPPLILHTSSRPVVSQAYVIVGFANGRLVALNWRTGALAWVQQIAEPRGTTDIERMVDIDVNPVVYENVIYVATYQGKIAAVNLKTGQILWRHKISAYAGIAADHSHLYLSDSKSYVWAFRGASGAVSWRQKKLFARMVTGPIIFNHFVAVADTQGYVHLMSKSDGHFVSRMELDNSGVVTPMIVYRNTLYVYTRKGNLYALKIS